MYSTGDLPSMRASISAGSRPRHAALQPGPVLPGRPRQPGLRQRVETGQQSVGRGRAPRRISAAGGSGRTRHRRPDRRSRRIRRPAAPARLGPHRMFFGLTSPCTSAMRDASSPAGQRAQRRRQIGMRQRRRSQVRVEPDRLEQRLVGEPSGHAVGDVRRRRMDRRQAASDEAAKPGRRGRRAARPSTPDASRDRGTPSRTSRPPDHAPARAAPTPGTIEDASCSQATSLALREVGTRQSCATRSSTQRALDGEHAPRRLDAKDVRGDAAGQRRHDSARQGSSTSRCARRKPAATSAAVRHAPLSLPADRPASLGMPWGGNHAPPAADPAVRRPRAVPPSPPNAGRPCRRPRRRSPTERSGQAPVNGISIHYAVYGQGSPVILLHGGLANADYWGNQVRALMPRHTVIVMDSRGHGRSTRDARPYGYDLMADDVVALLDYLKIPRADVVGWSDGGIIGLDLAMRHAGPGRQDFRLRRQHRDLRRQAEGWKRTRPSPPISSAPGMNTSAFRRRPGSTTPSWTRSAICGPTSRTGRTRSCARSRRPCWWWTATTTRRSSARTPNISPPTIPGAGLLILPNVSHFAFLQDPAMFNFAILHFLGDA